MTAKEVLVVTGCGGMGIAVARRLGAGRSVVLADYNSKMLSQVGEMLHSEGHDITTVESDVSSQGSVRNLVSIAASKGEIKVIVHTAGVSPVQATPKQIVEVDVMGTAYVIDEFVEVVGPGAVLICIASMAGTLMPMATDIEHLLATTPTAELANLEILNPATMDSGSAYSIAKRANQVRVQVSAMQWGAKGARIASISPGIISTPMGQQELEGASGDAMRQMIEASATKRIGTPDDIANAVAWLADPATSFVTGIDLLVDGGVVAALRSMGVR